MNNITIRVGPSRHREARTALSRLSLIVTCAVVCGSAGVPEVRAATHNATGYTPTLYVYQNDELVDVKTFKVADLEQCQHRASALLQLYLNHSDIEDDMRVVVKCVPVPPASAGHRKGELPPDGERRERLTDVPAVTL
jgi:hypothetical protein